jgi:AcrR family transcriptional regulator
MRANTGGATKPINDRGEETRQRLIDAALHVFAEYGFEGASTRMLADKAEANLATIPYYFKSKEGLYCAAAQYIVDRISEHTAPVFAKIDHALMNEHLAREDAIHLLHQYVDTFVAVLVGLKEADSWASFVMREQMQPGAAFEILYQGLMRRTHELCARLLGVIFKQRADVPVIEIRAHSIFGQILIFRTSRLAILRSYGWKDFSGEHMKLIQTVIRENVDRIVSGGI